MELNNLANSSLAPLVISMTKTEMLGHVSMFYNLLSMNNSIYKHKRNAWKS